jgi:hypothetical protein
MNYLLMVLFTVLSVNAAACPFCNSASGKQIRASLLGPDLSFNALIVLLPFVVCIIITWLIYRNGIGLRPYKKLKVKEYE